MKEFLNLLTRLGIDTRCMATIAPNAMSQRNKDDEAFYSVLFNEIRGYIYKYHYDSSIILQLADDARPAEKRERLETVVLPFLRSNNLLVLG